MPTAPAEMAALAKPTAAPAGTVPRTEHFQMSPSVKMSIGWPCVMASTAVTATSPPIVPSTSAMSASNDATAVSHSVMPFVRSGDSVTFPVVNVMVRPDVSMSTTICDVVELRMTPVLPLMYAAASAPVNPVSSAAAPTVGAEACAANPIVVVVPTLSRTSR
jgi:hypothetical protein